ncbi:glycosyltransferase [Bifidobacterium sp. ESL0775]|uniref:glycosyltransferase family 4 protein n=1 Tax=Bifidobacterium sp. ESL0775 TaxID=2983230 RepID=UPI0023F9D976|nr:glycosyltransferase [Bifidobacterium sp. ESL0775]WEV69112.1 glycosyltransferase [Bifidobacterium sp. ESL0775]
MKLVFAHDHKLRFHEGRYFTTGGLSNEVLGKYLDFFDTVTVFCRSVPMQKADHNLSEITEKRITIRPVSRNGSLKPSSAMLSEMEQTIAGADALIVKLHSVIAEFAIHFARKHGIPYLVESVADPWYSFWNYSVLGKLVAPFMTIITKREIKRAPYVLYVTDKYLESRYPTKGRWVGCSDVIIPVAANDVLNHRLDAIRHFGSVSRIGTLAQVDMRYKGQQYVIKALGILKKSGIRVDYELAGSGDGYFLKKVARENNVEDQVHFIGLLPHDEVFKWLDSLDLYIQPSKTEGLPRALAEAISRGCPALGSDVGGINELISPECIFRNKNTRQIAHMLRQIDSTFLTLQAQKNFLHAKQYSADVLNERRRSFYKEFAEYCRIIHVRRIGK